MSVKVLIYPGHNIQQLAVGNYSEQDLFGNVNANNLQGTEV